MLSHLAQMLSFAVSLKVLLAGLGAIVSALALGWRIYTWRHARRTRIDVKPINAFPIYDTPTAGNVWATSVGSEST